MLDKPDKTARLVATLKEAVPFEVELLASTLARLRERSPEIQIGAKEKVFDVAYEPRHGGIICLIRPTGTDDLVATSLTHLRIRASGLVQSSAGPLRSYLPLFCQVDMAEGTGTIVVTRT
jgi:hypothetical protein